MKNILSKIKINLATYFFFFSCFLTGYIKQALIIFLIVVIHEFGHALMSFICEYKVIKIELLPFGGVTIIDKPLNTPINKEFKIAIGGFLFQFLLVFIFMMLFYFNVVDIGTYQIFVKYNLTIVFFNMFCIYPLDGFKIVTCFAEKLWGYYYAYNVLGWISIIFLLVFIQINNLFCLNNYLVISFLVFKIYTYFKDKSKLYHRFLLERYLGDMQYQKIIYEKKVNLKRLKKDCQHYFFVKKGVVNERSLLAKRFDRTGRF